MDFPEDYEAYVNFQINYPNTAYYQYNGSFGLIPTHNTKSTFNSFTHQVSSFIFLWLRRYFKSQFLLMNNPILTEYYSIDTFFSPPKGMKGGWYTKIIWGKK